MDYQVFWIKISGGVFGRSGRGTAKVLQVFESYISVSSVSPPYNGTGVEVALENLSNVLPSMKAEDELTVNVLNGNRCECLYISCQSRAELITTLLNRMDDLNRIGTDFTLKKHSHQSEGLTETVFRVRSASLVKMVRNGLRHERKVNPAKKINFIDIVKVQTLTDDEHIVLLHLSSRVLKLSVGDVTPFLQAISRNMKFYLNRELQIERINTVIMVEDVAFHLKRMKAVPLLFEFQALKRSTFKGDERQRSLYISAEYFVEMTRDEVVATYSMRDILGLVVNDKNPNEVILEFKKCRPAEYYIENRDEFVASIADAAAYAKASQFTVSPVSLFHHMLPEQRPACQIDQEKYYTSRFLSEFNGKKDPAVLHIVLKEFASNVGKSHCNDLKTVLHLAELLKDWISCQDIVRSTTCCIVISRLLGSRQCFESLKLMADVVQVLLECMRIGNTPLAYAASVALRSAFKFSGETDVSISKQEQTNRTMVLRLENMKQLVTLLQTYSLRSGHVLQAYGMVKLMAAGLENLSMDSENWMKSFELSMMALGDVLCALSRSEISVLRESTAVLLEAILAKCSSLVSAHFRSLAVKRCLIIVHLKNALFSRMDLSRSRSARLLFHMIEGNGESEEHLQCLLPKGAFDLYHFTANIMIQTGKNISQCNFCAWIMLLEALRHDTIETPLFIWNDIKRAELQKFLEEEMKGFIAAASANHMLNYESADVKLVHSSQSEGEGTVVGNVHLELLVDHSPADETYAELWKVPDPAALFQAVFQALLFGFTPLFGRNNIPEVDLRLGVHVLTWIYERHASEVNFSLRNANVIEGSIGMLKEVIDTEHQVFIFKLVVFLLTMMEIGGRENVLRFVRAGGATVIVTLLVSSLTECCNDKYLFETDGWNSKLTKSLETVEVVGHNGEVRLARVPSGKVNEALDKASLNGSLNAKDAIKWQDTSVPSKIQFGLCLNVLEALLRISGTASYAESFPPSAASVSLSREELLCHLVQSLLGAKSPAFGRILTIVSQLVRSNNLATAQMHKLGAYDILLWKLLAGDITDCDRKMAVIFISQLHKLQLSDSVSSLYLPTGLVLKLESEEPDAFLQLLDSEENNPEVIWSRPMRDTLVHHLSCQLEPFVRSRAVDPMSLYVHTSTTVFYEELEDAVYTPPFYLHNLLDFERFPNYSINDPIQFMDNVMKDSRKLAGDLKHSATRSFPWTQEASRIGFLLRSLAYLLDRFPKLSAPENIEHVTLTLATPAVLNGNVDDSLVLDMILQATKLLKRAPALRAAGTPTECVNFALSALSLGTQTPADGSFPEPVTGQLELSVAAAFHVLEVACRSRAGRDILRKDLRWRKGLWCALCAAAGDAASDVPTGPSPISFAALSCLKHFVTEEPVDVFQQGLHLPLLLLIFSPASQTINGCKPALLLSATDVLRCLLEKDSSLLANVIPEPLLACLNDTEGPERFLTMQSSDLMQPRALWNQSIRDELRERLHDRLHQHAGALELESAVDDEIEWLRRFTYVCLSNKLVIDGLYIEGIMSCNQTVTDFVPESSFMNSMIDFLVEHSTVGLAEGTDKTEDRDGGAVSFSGYISVFTALEELMLYALKMDMQQLLTTCHYEALSSLVFQNKLDSRVQVRIAAVSKVLIGGGLLDTVTRSQLLGALSIQLWEATAEFSKEGMEDVLRRSLDALLSFSKQLPATLSAANYFMAHATLLPLLALFCDVNLPALRGSNSAQGFKATSRCLDHRVTSARILGQLLLAASGVNRRDKLLRDLQDKCNGEGRLHQATDMYELLSIAEQNCEESKLVKTLLLLFPMEILSLLARSPIEACKAYDGNFSTVTLIWDESRRHLIKTALIKEAARLRTTVNIKAACQLPPLSLQAKRPVFLRWTLVVATDDEKRPLYGQDHSDGYAQELYLGGFYVDQFLRNYSTSVIEPVKLERFLHELRSALVIGKSTDGLQADPFDFNDRRRMLLGLLCLFKTHPRLLSSRSNIDIFLPLYEILSSDSGLERRALAQPALLLLLSAVTHADIADCIVSEELVYTLSSFLSLNVPYHAAGHVGTDPRMCSLSLLLRLLRLSNNTVDIVLRLGVMSKLEDVILEFEGAPAVKRKAAECLAVMCADKRKGSDVQVMLEKLVPCNLKGHGTWKLQVTKIQEEVLDDNVLRHFLQHVYPSPWWTADTPEGREITEENVVAVVEASFCFPKARLSDFDNEAETVFVRSIACIASVDLRSVKVLKKRISGSVVVDFEVSFKRQEAMKKKLPEMHATLFKEKLERAGGEFFASTFLDSMGVPRVSSVTMTQPELLRQTSWKSGSSSPSLGDKNVIYEGKTETTVEGEVYASSPVRRASSPPPEAILDVSPSPAPSLQAPSSSCSTASAALPVVRASIPRLPPPPPPALSYPVPSALSSPLSVVPTLTVKVPPPPPPAPPPPPPLPSSRVLKPGRPMLCSDSPTHAAGTNGMNGHKSGCQNGSTDGPVEETPEPLVLPNSGVLVQTEDGRRIPLEEGLQLILRRADVTEDSQRVACSNFLEAFEDEQDELGKMVEKYSKLIQKFPLQPQLCYDLMVAWEENCIDLLSEEELAKYGRSIVAYDICRLDDPELAATEAKQKFQGIFKIRREREWKEKSDQLKGDMSAELAKAVCERKEKVVVNTAENELKALARGKIQKKAKRACLSP